MNKRHKISKKFTTRMALQGIGLNPPGTIHYIDHLSVICHILNIPLLFIDSTDYELAEKYYPGLDVQHIDYLEFNPQLLIENYKFLITSDPWSSSAFFPVFQKLAKDQDKQVRYIFCPHGFSDKGFYFKQCIQEDITLVYGQNMLDLIAEQNGGIKLNNYVITGNYRYTYYKQNKKFFDLLAEEEVFKEIDKNKKTILYAPTWHDKEGYSTFFDVTSYLISELPDHFTLVVKPHPRLELDNIAEFYRIQGLCESKKKYFLC